MIRVLIVDDHQIVRDGVKYFLNPEKDIKIIGEVDNGKKALIFLKSRKVDVVIMDLIMPVMDGKKAIKLIKERYPYVKVLVLSMSSDYVDIIDCLKMDVSGYMTKDKTHDLAIAIKKIYDGGEYYDDIVVQKIILGVKGHINIEKPKTLTPLTKREVDVLKLIARGMSTPMISKELFIAHSTVETHRRNLIEKTGVNNSKELISFATKQGLVKN